MSAFELYEEHQRPVPHAIAPHVVAGRAGAGPATMTDMAREIVSMAAEMQLEEARKNRWGSMHLSRI